LQGLTLSPLIKSLRLRDDGNEGTLMELRARFEGARAALERLERICEDERVPGGATEEYARSSADRRRWRRDLIGAERDLDLEESRIGG
jgi:hypothetical protein